MTAYGLDEIIDIWSGLRMEERKEEHKDEGKKYNLYTEHILPEKGRKIKRLLKKAAFVVVMAVIFGVVAGLVMIIIYNTGIRFFKTDSSQEITLENAYTTEEETTEKETESVTGETVTVPPEETKPQETKPEGETIPEIGELTGYMEALRAAVAVINKSSVSITVTTSSGSWVEQSVEDYGMIVSNDGTGYYILTSYSRMEGAETITAVFSDGMGVSASLVAGDSVSNMAVIKAEREISEDIPAAKLGNLEQVAQGDLLLAVGNLYGMDSSFGYGIATGINGVIYDTDSKYEIINTDINSDASGYGFICNSDGEVVAVAMGTDGEASNKTLSGYAVSSVRSLIEDLINGRQRPYFGIKGQDVTKSAAESYGIPEGVYIAAVEVSSPAHTAGIQTGDIITGMGDAQITDMEGFMEQLDGCSAGDTLTVTVKRKSRDSYKEIVFRVVLGVE